MKNLYKVLRAVKEYCKSMSFRCSGCPFRMKNEYCVWADEGLRIPRGWCLRGLRRVSMRLEKFAKERGLSDG